MMNEATVNNLNHKKRERENQNKCITWKKKKKLTTPASKLAQNYKQIMANKLEQHKGETAL